MCIGIFREKPRTQVKLNGTQYDAAQQMVT